MSNKDIPSSLSYQQKWIDQSNYTLPFIILSITLAFVRFSIKLGLFIKWIIVMVLVKIKASRTSKAILMLHNET